MAKLTQQQADTLLDKLSTDDAFRASFQKDPAAALKSIGVPVKAAGCMQAKSLATKDAFVKSRKALSKQLTAEMDDNVFKLG